MFWFCFSRFGPFYRSKCFQFVARRSQIRLKNFELLKRHFSGIQSLSIFSKINWYSAKRSMQSFISHLDLPKAWVELGKVWCECGHFGAKNLSYRGTSPNATLTFHCKAQMTWEYELNRFFGCCHDVSKMFDFWPHLLLMSRFSASCF